MRLSSYGEIKIAVVSNVTIEPFFSKKIKNYIDGAKVCFVPYDEYTYGIEQISNSDLILLWINLEVVFPDYCVDILEGKFTLEFLVGSVKSIYDDMLNRIAALGGKKVLIMLQDSTRRIEIVRGSVADKDDILRRFNGELVENYSKVVTLIDLDRIIANVGIKSAYDHVNRYRWNAIYTADLINEVAQEVYKQVLIGKGVTKKCIVLDCDNVLWGGVISEDGIEKIDIGNMGEGLLFQDFQRFLLEMYYNGVILAVASKNDCADIMNIFDKGSINDKIEPVLNMIGNVCSTLDYGCALSLVENEKDLSEFMNLTDKKIQLVSKIETNESINNLEEIVKRSDGIMLARGDLALLNPYYNLFQTLDDIIKMAKHYHKSVYMATDILQSLDCGRYIPSRSDIMDLSLLSFGWKMR